MNKKRLIAGVLLLTLCFSSLPCGAATEYLLGPGDVLEVHAWDDKTPDLLYVNPVPVGLTSAIGDPHTMTVSVDGRLYIPLIGTIYVTGLTISDIEKTLTKNIKKLGVSGPPHVSVFLRTPKNINVDVLGEVTSPGTKSIPDGDPQTKSIINCLQLAGGLTEFGDNSSIKVFRKKENGETTILNVDLSKIANEQDLQQNIVLQSGDVIIVGGSRLNKVIVMGEINSPGQFRYFQGATVTDYIVAAGGFKKNSATSNLKIIRNDKNNPIIKNINLSKFFSEGKKNELAILPGDIISVEGDWSTAWGNVIAFLGVVRDTAILVFFFKSVI